MLCLKSQIRVGCDGRGTSVGDAALAGVSMDAARSMGLPGTSGKGPETIGGGDPFMICWLCLFDLLIQSPSACNNRSIRHRREMDLMMRR
jgi:hypothetical protein